MRYSEEQLKTINNMKLYLKGMRELSREREYLLEEFNEEPAPHSPSFEETKGTSLSQITRMNDYTFKRELLSKKIQLLSDIINNFMIKTLLLPTRQRQILETYFTTLTYKEMIDTLNDKYYISTSTYKRELPEICLSLSQYITSPLPSIDEINRKFLSEI